MESRDYPALYQAADSKSLNSQACYLTAVKIYIGLSIVGTILSAFNFQDTISSICSAIIFLGSLFLSIFLAFKKNENIWYLARAVSESIKTLTWRFMMCTEPFESIDEQVARSKFNKSLKEILNEHKELSHDLDVRFPPEKQISDKMMEVRYKSLLDKKTIYLNERINDQYAWYTKIHL